MRYALLPVALLLAGCPTSGEMNSAMPDLSQRIAIPDYRSPEDMTGGSTPDAGSADATPTADLAPAATDDAGSAPDLLVAAMPDLSVMEVPDMSMQAAGDDLAMPLPDYAGMDIEVDLATPPVPDMTVIIVPDLTVPVIPDLSVARSPDLSMAPPPPDLSTVAKADLSSTPMPDLTMSGSNPDLVTIPPDLTMSGTSCSAVKVNEIQTGDLYSADNEYVELYNPCSIAVRLTGWTLVYRAADNTNPVAPGNDGSPALYSFTSSDVIQPGGFLLYAGLGFFGTADGALNSGLKDGAGSVGLRDPTGTLVDSVAYGSAATGNAFIEKSPAPAPAGTAYPGESIGRYPDGADSNDNSKDFVIQSYATPGSPNSGM